MNWQVARYKKITVAKQYSWDFLEDSIYNVEPPFEGTGCVDCGVHTMPEDDEEDEIWHQLFIVICWIMEMINAMNKLIKFFIICYAIKVIKIIVLFFGGSFCKDTDCKENTDCKK